jgi:hypothetical protein
LLPHYLQPALLIDSSLQILPSIGASCPNPSPSPFQKPVTHNWVRKCQWSKIGISTTQVGSNTIMRIPTLSVPIWIIKEGKKKLRPWNWTQKGDSTSALETISHQIEEELWHKSFIKKCKTNIMQQNGRNTSWWL